ncbi:hypothetical protein F53441_9637 [Fusarium austroafricanum]|uniref:NAD-dependent epimerase/dehydratase domain-containing protein n=1 Tax=Fusarium austroafricanum TaxID=2364996 RepID=A0A8H4KB99_9HYPO|nr:hypothetical protein F53441_9637 [Fusarium austroafricanum]
MDTPKILLTGATGYVGGSVLTAILSNTSLQNLPITALVRTEAQATTISTLPVTPLLYTNLDDTSLLTQTAPAHDIVIHASLGYHIPAAKALLRGLAQRKKETAREVHYIHTSGTSNFGNRPISKKFTERRVFLDKDDIYAYEKMREGLEPYIQRTADVAVFEMGEELGVRTYIVCPPLIYGRGTGLFKTSSIPIPTLVRAAIARGEAIYVGDGQGVSDHAHIEDVAALYTLIVEKIVANEKVPFGKEGFFFANAGEQTWLEIAQEIARVGCQRGKLAAEPKSVTLTELSKDWFRGDEHVTELGLCSNSETRGERSRELGWEPLKDDSQWKETIAEEFDVALQAMA